MILSICQVLRFKPVNERESTEEEKEGEGEHSLRLQLINGPV